MMAAPIPDTRPVSGGGVPPLDNDASGKVDNDQLNERDVARRTATYRCRSSVARAAVEILPIRSQITFGGPPNTRLR